MSTVFTVTVTVLKLIFAVLDVSLTMGLTRCYKTEGFYIYICSYCTYFTLFLLHTLVQAGGNLFAYKISMRYLNLRLR